MNWLRRLFGKPPEPSMLTDLTAGRIPTVKAPPGHPGDPPTLPKRSTEPPEKWAAIMSAHQVRVREHRAKVAAFKRKRAMSLGITHYRWMDSRGGPIECSVAKKYDGKLIAYANPPPEGHPGEGKCDMPDWCRCSANAEIPGF